MEEDIETLEDLKNIFIHLKNYGWVNDIKKDIVADKVIKAIENLIARNKESEKLYNIAYTGGKGFERQQWKEKIQKKIEDKKKALKNNELEFDERCEIEHLIREFQELLQER